LDPSTCARGRVSALRCRRQFGVTAVSRSSTC
jgi:hypothetical protein